MTPGKNPSRQPRACCTPDPRPAPGIARDADSIRTLVREGYGEVARRGPGAPRERARRLGYSDTELDLVPEEANLGLGCGNPTALAGLRPGDVVVDLGAGAGIDALVAAGNVGTEGRVIGVDMTREMLERARQNAVKMGVADRVEFREGIIERLPVVSESADVVISNCVINLSPDKPRVFREAYRVLKPGGRLCVSDILLSEPLPADMAKQAAAYVACLGGAWVADDYLAAIQDAGFVDLGVKRDPASDLFGLLMEDPGFTAAVETLGEDRVAAVADTVFSYTIEARKP